MPYGLTVLAAESVPKLMLASAVLASYHHKDVNRSNAALVAITQALGVSNEEYDCIMEHLVEVLVDLPSESELARAELAARRHTAITTLKHRANLRLSTMAVLAELNLAGPLPLPVEEGDLSTLGDREHPRRLPLEPGPWVLLRPACGERAGEAHYVPDFPHHPHRGVRQSAVAHLQTVWPVGSLGCGRASGHSFTNKGW